MSTGIAPRPTRDIDLLGDSCRRPTEAVLVSVAGAKPTPIRVPSLVGGILLKARALGLSRGKFDEHRQDLIILLSFVEDPRVAAEELSANERRWLTTAHKELRLSDPNLGDRFAADRLERARQVLELLVGNWAKPSPTA